MRILISILCCLSLLPTVSLAEGKKYALLVGVETYDPTFLTRLSFAEDDAEELGKTFKELGFDVIVMTHSAEIPAQRPNTAEKILDQLSRRVKGLQAEDTLVVGFSGHGVQYKQPRKLKSGGEETYFLCPEEANLNNVDSLVSIAKVYELIQQCAAERKLLIVDACRNEDFSTIGKNAPEIELTLTPAGVTRRTVPKGFLALYSCTEGERSYDFPELKHSAFCYHVLKYLKGEADPKNYFRDQISVGGLARYASAETRDYVFAKLSREQLPEVMGRTNDWPLGSLRQGKPSNNTPPTNPTVSLAKGKKYALLVGVETYDPAQLNRLQFADDDAIALGKALEFQGFNVVVMTSQSSIPARKPISAQDILDQLDRRLRDKNPEDTIILAFSGHGVQLKSDPVDANGNKESYFCPERANLDDKTSLVPMSLIIKKLADCPAEKKLLLCDACRNEAMPKAAQDKDKPVVEIELDPAGVTRRTVSKGMVVLFSCSSKEKSFELADLGHSVFTYQVLKYLRGDADQTRYPRQQLSINELVTFVSRETRDYIENRLSKDQRPELVTPGGFNDWNFGRIVEK
ncbi:MAG: caspase domain-containing protein [Planctomycetaceae bacterium]